MSSAKLARGKRRRGLDPLDAGRRRLELLALSVLILATGLTGWFVYKSSVATPPPFSAVTFRELDDGHPSYLDQIGIGLLLSKPDTNASLIISCGALSRALCSVTVLFPARIPPGLRWAVAATSNTRAPGAEGYATQRRLVTEVDTYYRARTQAARYHRYTITGGPAITGIVNGVATPVPSSFEPPRTGDWTGLIPAEYGHPFSFELQLGLPLYTVTNGVAQGSTPYVGFDASTRAFSARYEISGIGGLWYPPRRPTYSVSVLNAGDFPVLQNESPAEVRGPDSGRWTEHTPFEATWERANPTEQNAARTRIFLAGLLLALSTSAAVALLQVAVRRTR